MRSRFCGCTASPPLALALLIVDVGVAVWAMAIGDDRITQLRRLSCRRH